jgi:diguanylate cyclase (GGDEF)-like protein
MVLLWACSAWAAPPAPLTTLRQIHALSNAEASQGIPVAFEATVTYYRDYEHILFVQEGDAAIYISYSVVLKLSPGDRLQVTGKTQKSFTPIVIADNITQLGRAALPKAIPASFNQMIRAETDCRLVTVRGLIRSADRVSNETGLMHYIRLQLLMDGGYIGANLDASDAVDTESLLDTKVELTGIANEQFDNKMHQTGILVMVQSPAEMRILQSARVNPWTLSETPMDRVIGVYHASDSTSRVRVHGSITYYLPGSAVVLQNGANSIWIQTLTHQPLRIGDAADATGFPEVHEGIVNLARGEIHDTGVPAPVTPLMTSWKALSLTGWASPGHHDDLLSLEGQVVTGVREASQDEFVLAVEGKLFSAIYRHPEGPLPASKVIATGSKVRVTGICIQDHSDPFTESIPFNILLRSLDDIVVTAPPSPINTRNLLIALGLLLLVVFAVIARGWILERRVRRQTSAAAAIERQRSRILEDINGSRPLAEVLEEIGEMVSFSLDGAPCWCETADGERLGNLPGEQPNLRIEQIAIASRSGPPLGLLYAGFIAGSPPSGAEFEALQNGARLATLAIETRRLNADLRRRSEYDLLTDIPNRFAMEKFIKEKIEEAARTGGKLGLIYIDLDKFKPINDTYGHHVGDLFLQAVARRMSRQLLGSDMLARLGGDEFAALVLLPHGVSDLKTIVARLDQCFLDPFVLEEQVIDGAASIGFALFPEDGATQDELVNAADAAMYEVKKAKKQIASDIPVLPQGV